MKKIFLIDNVDSIAEFYTDFLGLKGYKMAVSVNVEEFSERLDSFDPDLVIFDTDMPRSESYKFATLKSSNPGLKYKPTLLLTGFVNEAKIKGFEQIENYEFLDKRSTNSQILRRIESLLQHTHPESNGFYRSKDLAEVPGLSS